MNLDFQMYFPVNKDPWGAVMPQYSVEGKTKLESDSLICWKSLG
jgi:hypothetical protein